jgi:phospho-N-acetylmuramoyl-pentapeptide-transferase
MLYYLHELKDWFGPLNVFQYISFRAIGSAATSLLFCLLLGPGFITTLTRLKLGQPIRGREEVHMLADLHGSKKGTPTMGGLMVLAALTFSTLLWARWDVALVWLVLFSTLAMGGLGFMDDYAKIRKNKSLGLTSRQKLLGQAVIAVAVGVYLLNSHQYSLQARSLEIPFLKFPILENMGWLALGFFLLVIIGSSNAVNLTDGLDGLAAGCTVCVAVVFAIFCYLTGDANASQYLLLQQVKGAGELSIFCLALAGAGLGFLWFNCHPARVFMGDTGSLAIGGALGVVSICVNQELLLVLVGGVFVMEALSVILQVASFKLTGKRIFAMAPIHHHFELKGWSESTVVVRFWILTLICALAGLATLKLR